jgi:hypothetical protein
MQAEVRFKMFLKGNIVKSLQVSAALPYRLMKHFLVLIKLKLPCKKNFAH